MSTLVLRYVLILDTWYKIGTCCLVKCLERKFAIKNRDTYKQKKPSSTGWVKNAIDKDEVTKVYGKPSSIFY